MTFLEKLRVGVKIEVNDGNIIYLKIITNQTRFLHFFKIKKEQLYVAEHGNSSWTKVINKETVLDDLYSVLFGNHPDCYIQTEKSWVTNDYSSFIANTDENYYSYRIYKGKIVELLML